MPFMARALLLFQTNLTHNIHYVLQLLLCLSHRGRVANVHLRSPSSYIESYLLWKHRSNSEVDEDFYDQGEATPGQFNTCACRISRGWTGRGVRWFVRWSLRCFYRSQVRLKSITSQLPCTRIYIITYKAGFLHAFPWLLVQVYFFLGKL